MSSYNRQDRFYKKAKGEGYPARSAYKLIEINQRFHLLKPGRRILDLGSSPGGWLKVCEEKLKNKGHLVGVDLLPLQYQPAPWVRFILGDFLEQSIQEEIKKEFPQGVDWVISDMSPNISGIKFKDLEASMELCQRVLEFIKNQWYAPLLVSGGGLIVKIFPGPQMGEFKKELRKYFQKISDVLPEATRKTSNEIYLVCEGKK